MKIQSLSVHVPAGCPNKCKFCVSKMHDSTYPNLIEHKDPSQYEFYVDQYKKRLRFAVNNECNTVMLTGSGEPLLNIDFLKKFGKINSELPKPFEWIEVQTSGIFLEDNIDVLINDVGVSTISLSLSNMFDNKSNAEINTTPKGLEIDIISLCKKIKDKGLNLRLSLNMTNVYNDIEPEDIFKYAKNVLNADQITFRQLYTSKEKNTPQDIWIFNNRCEEYKLEKIKSYILEKGESPRVLPFGLTRYVINNMSVVVDNNCMSKDNEMVDTVKYLILRPDCKLYDQWDNPGSLLF